MEKKEEKVIIFPKKYLGPSRLNSGGDDKDRKPKKKFKKKIKIIGAIVGLIPIILTLVEIYQKKNDQVQFRPSLNINVEYFEEDNYKEYMDKRGKYIKKLAIYCDEKNVEPIDICVESFFNIVYFDQKNDSLIKQILPVYDVENMSKEYAPFDINTYNLKTGLISEIGLNSNSYEMANKISEIFVETERINYDDYLYNIFGDLIINSIDLEFFITIKYKDVYNNEYTEIFLCETGFRNYSAYIIDALYNDYTDENVRNYNLECFVKYASLKRYMDNFEFDARVSKIQDRDMIYKIFHEYYSNIINSPGCVVYAPCFYMELEDLIEQGYNSGELLFSLNEKEKMWQIK